MSTLNHSFDTEMAARYSIEEAILIHHFQFWIEKNRNLKRNFHEGRTWTYETIEEIAAHFSYLTLKQVRRTLDKLVKKKILVKNNFNKHAYDRTTWYAFNDEEKFLSGEKCPNGQMEMPKQANGNDQTGTPIPDTKTDTKTDTKESTKEREAETGVSPPLAPNPKKMIKRRENVSTSTAEHQKLLNENGTETTEALYDKLQEWKERTPRSKWKKGDYKSILVWVVDAVHEDRAKKQKRKKTGIDEGNVELAKRIAENFKQLAYSKKIAIETKPDSIIFYSTHPQTQVKPTKIKYSENGFKEKLDQALRKWRLL